MIEFDIQPSKDGQLMVFHDRQGIERTTNGQGRVPELPFSYLRSLDAGSWFNIRFQGEQIPTLAEVLSNIPSSTQLNIELKFFDKKTDWFESEIVNIIHKFKISHRSVITARHIENITRLQSLDSSIDCALLQKERDKDTYYEIISNLQLHTAQIRQSALDPKFIQKCHDQGIRIFYFYADEPVQMKEVIDLGIDGLLTNYPDCLKNVLEREKMI